MATLRLLLQVAFRNLFRHWVKSSIVGAIMAFGAFLIVFGLAHVSSIRDAMEKSVTDSISGHLQLYDEKAKDDLALFGGMGMGRPDNGIVTKFEQVRATVGAVPNVDTVVPMGLDVAFLNAGSELDQSLQELRTAVNKSDTRAIRLVRDRIRQQIEVLEEEAQNLAALSSDTSKTAEISELLARGKSDAFWAEFDREPLPALEWLDNKIAPIEGEGKTLFLRYVGTDLNLFEKKFDRFEIVQGTQVPEGKRGLLVNQKFMEDWVKNLVARELDKLKKSRDEGKTFAADTALQEQIKRMSRQYKRVMYQLDADEAAELEPALRTFLGGAQGDLPSLLQSFLLVDDANFDARYKFFYDTVAPRLKLYEFKAGDTITVKSWTRSGYQRSLNVKVWGIFSFKGVESSALAGSFSLTDLATFRDLLGLMTAERKAELSAIKAKVGVKDVSRDDAEADLFGEASDVSATVAAVPAEVPAAPTTEEVLAAATGETWDLPVTEVDRNTGVIINAAVILKDPSLLRVTKPLVEAAIKEAGLGLKVIGWQESAGIVGQFILVVQLVLFVAILIIITVALVIINNTMVMATMERTGEIGTMRAIGAQRSFIVALFLLEGFALAVLAGLVGSALALGAVAVLGSVGVPAPNDFLVFLFGGPRLYPAISGLHVVFALIVTAVVGFVSAAYPAFLATRVQPIEAMRAED